MLSVSIQVSKQEVKDFPLDSIRIDSRWQDMLDPNMDWKFQKPRKKRKIA